MKRQRGRGRKPGNNSNRNFESNGPDVKVRGSASHIYDKYMQLARDATSSGDRVMAEAYYQHAEHYLRIVQANQPKQRDDQNQSGEQQHDQRGDNRTHDDRAEASNRGEDQGRSDRSEGEDGSGRNRNRRGRGRNRSDDQTQSGSDDPLQVVDPEAGGDDQPSAEGESEAPKRRRGRPRKSEAGADHAAEDALKAAEKKSGDGDASSDDAAA
jgi:hypothetical protein